jgi:hypothetical protein
VCSCYDWQELMPLSPFSDRLREPRRIRWALVLGKNSIYPGLSTPPVLIQEIDYWLGKAIKLTGVTPTCWRPPYGDVNVYSVFPVSSNIAILTYVFCRHRTAFPKLQTRWACRLSSGSMAHSTGALVSTISLRPTLIISTACSSAI